VASLPLPLRHHLLNILLLLVGAVVEAVSAVAVEPVGI
jgi:hypothetical protein